MDLKGLFNFSEEDKNNYKTKQKSKQEDTSLIKELLDEVTDSYEKNHNHTKQTGKDVADKFLETYGDFEAYMNDHLPKRSEQYSEAIFKEIEKTISLKKEGEHGPVIGYSLLDVVKGLLHTMIEDNSDEPNVELVKAAAIANALEDALPDGGSMNAVVTCLALTSLASLKIAELQARIDAHDLME
jgi:hypothetical protein